MSVPTPEEDWDYTLMASQLFYEMLGRRMVWPMMRAVDAYPVNRELILTGRPIRTIHSVTVVQPGASTVLAEENYEKYSGFRIRIAPSVALPRPTYYRERCQTEIHVDYTYGSRPPVAVRRAIAYYAEQLELAYTGSPECKLPKRITSIARQGINMTILDTADYLDKGRTGLPEVDAVIAMYGGKAKARARLFTEKNPPARRLSVVPIDVENTTLEILQGSDWEATWPVYDSLGVLQDLTGWTAVMQVRPSIGSLTLLHEWTTADDSIEVTNTGQLIVYTPAAISTAWTWTTGYFQIELTSPLAEVTRLDQGTITVDPEIVVEA